MHYLIKQKMSGLRPSVYSSLAMAFVGMGDAFLYPFLPLYSKEIGIPPIWVGLLLSINRFVRIFLSPVMTVIFQKFNARQVIIIATLVAIGSTIGYGLNAGVIAWILSRSIWGLCFSAMRISTASFALNNNSQGLALGLSNGLYEIGPLTALLIGPVILFYAGVEYTFYLLALLSSPALFFSFRILPNDALITTPDSPKVSRPSSINLLTFLTALITEGFLIIIMAVLIQRHYNLSTFEAAATCSGLLILRRACILVASPLGGMSIDLFGVQKILITSLLSVSAGTFLLGLNFVMAGLITVFIFQPVNSAVCLIAASARSKHQLEAINHNSCYRDAGAAVGTIFGGFLLSSPDLNNILLISALLPIFFVNSFIKLSRPS